MYRQLSGVGWRADFYPAVRPEDRQHFPSIGARGCFLSHLAVLKQAHAAGVDQLVILEDDVDFVPGFKELWDSAVRALEQFEWSLFYPGHVLDDLPPGLSLLFPSTGVLCTHFIVFNKSAFAPLIEGLETILARPPGHPLGGPMHVDGAYSTIRMQNPAIKTYAFAPSLGYQRSSRTDIGTLKWFDRVSAFRPLVNAARRLKSQM